MEFWQDLDIAIVKATNHVECPPKERYLRSEWFLFLGVGCKQIPHMAISNSGSPNVARFYFIYLLLDAEILFATSANRPRSDVGYSICTLARRLSKTKNWIVGLC